MEFEEFKQVFTEELRCKAREEKICITFVQKINSGRKEAITLMLPPGALSPTITLEDIFLEYKRAGTYDGLAEFVLGQLKKGKEKTDGIRLDLSSFEGIRNRIFCRLINRTANEELLKNVPCRRWMDLAIVCYIQIGDWAPGGSAQVTRELVQRWHVTEEEVMDTAWKNTMEQKDPFFRSLGSVLCEMQEQAGISGPDWQTEGRLYLLSNRERWYGSVCMAYPLIPFFIEKSLQVPAYYILPSSIHEWLILPDRGEITRDELDSLIRRVNATEVDPAEVLSDHAYYYSGGHIQTV